MTDRHIRAFGIDDRKALSISHFVPAVRRLGLLGAPQATMENDHERSLGQVRRAVHDVAPIKPTEAHGLGAVGDTQR